MSRSLLPAHMWTSLSFLLSVALVSPHFFPLRCAPSCPRLPSLSHVTCSLQVYEHICQCRCLNPAALILLPRTPYRLPIISTKEFSCLHSHLARRFCLLCIHLHTDGGGCHARCRPAHQEFSLGFSILPKDTSTPGELNQRPFNNETSIAWNAVCLCHLSACTLLKCLEFHKTPQGNWMCAGTPRQPLCQKLSVKILCHSLHRVCFF